MSKLVSQSIVFNYPEKEDIRLKYIYYTFFMYLFELYPNSNKYSYIEYNNTYNILYNLDNKDKLENWFYILSHYVEENCSTLGSKYNYYESCREHKSDACKRKNHKGNTCRKTQ